MVDVETEVPWMLSSSFDFDVKPEVLYFACRKAYGMLEAVVCVNTYGNFKL